MALKDLAEKVLTAGAILVAGANVNAQGPIIYQTWPHYDQIMQAQTQRRGLEFDLSHFEPGNYIAIIERKNQTCELVGGIYGGFRLNLTKSGVQIPNSRQITCWHLTTDGDYNISVRGNGVSYPVGNAYLEAGDKLKFYKTEEKRNELSLPYAILGTNKLDPINAKKFGLPLEGYIVKPHPYKEKSFIIIKDTDSEKFEMPYKTSLKTVNPDGSIHYNIQVRDIKGNLLREYIEPSNERLEKNPDYKPGLDKPKFQSTAPVLRYPDGTMEGYRLLREGESLWDVLKEGPMDRYVPSGKVHSTAPLLDSEDRGCPVHRYVP